MTIKNACFNTYFCQVSAAVQLQNRLCFSRLEKMFHFSQPVEVLRNFLWLLKALTSEHVQRSAKILPTDRPILVPQSYWASSGERVVVVISLFSICHCLSAYHHLLSYCLFSTITFSSFPSNQQSCLRSSLLLDQKTF